MALGNKNKKADRVASAQQWVEEGGAGGDFTVLDLPKGISMWAPKEEKVYNVTIVPYEVTKAINRFSKKMATPGQLYYERSIQTHAQVGPEGSKKSYVCAAGTFGKKCPICEYRNKLSSPDNDPDTIKLIKDLRQKDRQLWNILVHEEKDKGVQVWEVSWHLFGTFLQEKLKKADPEKKERMMRFHDPERGYDFRLAPREKQMGQYKFLEFTDIEFKRRKVPLTDALIDSATDLDSIVKEMPYDKLKEIISGGASDETEEDEDTDDSELEEEDDEEEVKPKKKVRVKNTKPNKKTKPDPEEDDDAEQEDEEDDGDDEENESEEEEDGSDDEESDEGDDDDGSDDDDNDTEEDDEDDEVEEAESSFSKGDKVAFTRKGKKHVGIVVRVMEANEECKVRVKGMEKPLVVSFDDLKPATKKPPVIDENDEDEPVPAKKLKKKVKGKKPGRKDPF